MKLNAQLIAKNFTLENVSKNDLSSFITVEKMSHFKYVAEHPAFFGEWNESLLEHAFYEKFNFSCFQKVLLNHEIVGFLGYDKKENIIDNVFIKLLGEVQNQGIGTLFLSHLTTLSETLRIPTKIVVIKTNPAKNLYQKWGFEFYKEEGALHYLSYSPKGSSK